MLLTLGVVPTLPPYSVVLASSNLALSSVEFYSIRVTTLSTSSLAVSNKASSSVNLIVIAFFYKSLVEHIVNLNCGVLQFL